MDDHGQRGRTAILVLDPYNDFLAEGGKLYPLLEPIARANGAITNMRRIVSAGRAAGARIVFVPHHRWAPGDFDHWAFPSPTQVRSGRNQNFARGSWGGTFHDDFPVLPGDIVVAEHWAQSGFANTDLDQQLKQHGIDRVVLVGMLANTCIESTARFAMELGYHVTLVTDATAAFSEEAMHAAHSVNGPTFAHALTTTAELIMRLGQRSTSSAHSQAS